jgi:chitinase
MGADRDKVIMGVPFYGQSYTLENNDQNDVGAPAFGPGNPGEFTQQPGMLAYYEVCDRSELKKQIFMSMILMISKYFSSLEELEGC